MSRARWLPEAGLRTTSGGAPGSMACPESDGGQVELLPLPRFLVNQRSFQAASKQPQVGDALPYSPRAELRRASAGTSAHQVREMPGASTRASSGPGLADLSDCVPSEAVWDGVTTIMIKNIPSRCHQEEVLDAISQIGFASRYTFFYLPKKTGKMLNYGYAFIGLSTEQDVTDFRRSLDGFQFVRRKSLKAIALAPAKIQGFHDNVQHFVGSRALDCEQPPIFRMVL